VDDILVEQLGIGLRPMPTKAICQAFNELRQDIVIMLDLQKHLAEKEYQVQMFKDQKQILFKGKKEKRKLKKKTIDMEFMGISDVFGEITPKKRSSSSLVKSDKKKKKRKKEFDEKDLY